jgi:light-regulated signal transduction histidine kinase (bacteriophytochrome)
VVERTGQLEAAYKELEVFSYSVSHNLRAPLRAIDGYARLLQLDHALQLSPEAVRHLQVIRDNARQMGRLIDGLLVFTRLGRRPLNKRSIATAELACQVLESLSE